MKNMTRSVFALAWLIILAWQGTSSTQASPSIAGVTNAPAAPTAGAPAWVAAQVSGTPAVTNVVLSYSTGVSAGVSATNTAFSETMGATSINAWTGSGADNPWTVAYSGTKNPFQQSGTANNGGGNTNGLMFKNTSSTINLADNTITTVNPIDARGTSAYVEFYVQGKWQAATESWAFQLNAGSGFVTRTNETISANHAFRVYHYDLQPSELVSNLVMRFQFSSDATATNNQVLLDNLALKVVTTPLSWTNVTMYDDGAHQDGAAGDGAYGGQIPAFAAGTSVKYFVAATDNTGVTATNPAGAPLSTMAYTVQAAVAPSIALQPQSQTLVVGNNATFTVTAGGTTPLSYQWQFNGASLAGATSASLSLANVQTTNAGNYTVVVTNSVGSITSSVAVLTVVADLPPVIANVTNTPAFPIAGSPAWITAQASGTLALTNVAVIYNTGASGIPSYTNTMFSETMGAASTGAWTGSGCDNAWTVAYNGTKNPFSQSGSANVGSGNTNGLQFKGATGTTNLADNMITTVSAIDARGTSAYVEFYVQAKWQAATLAWAFQLNSGSGFVTRTNETLSATHATQLFRYNLQPSELVSNLVMRFQFASDAAATNNQIFLDSIVVKTANGGTIPVSVTMFDDGAHQDGGAGDGVYGGQLPAFAAGTNVNYYVVATDAGGVSATNPASAPATTFSYAVQALTAPVITQQPQSQTVALGSNVSMTVTANGTLPLSYQWSFNGASLPGATNSTLLLPNVQTTNAGNYFVTVTNLAGSTNSTTAALAVIVNQLPVISNVALSPAAPTSLDTPWVTANATDDLGVASVKLNYRTNAAAVVTNVVFSETMAAATVSSWTGAGCDNPWTVVYNGTRNPFAQAGGAVNTGGGNTNGLQFKPTAAATNLAANTITATNIDARGVSGYVEFWVRVAQYQGATANWAFQLNAGSGFVTRTNETVTATHVYRVYHYDLQPSELVSNLAMRFEFACDASVTNQLNLDNISVTVANAGTDLAMYDDGLHQDGAAGDHVYGAQIPRIPTGTTVRYYVSVTDAGGLTTNSPSGAPGTTYSYVVAPPPNQPPAIFSVTNSPTLPTDLAPVWITAKATDEVSVVSFSLTYDIGNGPTNVTMLDDGSSHDGAAGDSTYGGMIPIFPIGTTVSYYLVAADGAGLSSTNPTGAPAVPYTYTVTSNSLANLYYNIVLGRPTDQSIALSLMASNDLEYYIAYGTQSGAYVNQTATYTLTNGIPSVVTLSSLASGQQYYYTFNFRSPGGSAFTSSPERRFHTQRSLNDTFTFAIEADPHYFDNDPPVWKLCLSNMLVDSPDFLIDVGDTFMGEKYYSTNAYTLSIPGINDASRITRNEFFGVSGHSLPLFLVNGNHDPELGWFLNFFQPTNSPPVWADQARQVNFPCPIPGGFYSGSTNIDPFLGNGARDAYYSFEWGNALFVAIDPFWYSWQGTTKTADHWGWTLGTNQFQWLKHTLENSHAKFKFVFAHHLVGGSFAPGNANDARGGLSPAPYFEWGGLETNGVYAFDTKRPGWGVPIQTMLLSNGVNAFFHGHDHIFVKEDLYTNGAHFVYQECPQPSRQYANLGPVNSAAGYDYTNATAIQGSSGYLRVTVSPTNAAVDYVRVFLPVNEVPGVQTNRMVTYSYAFTAASISGTTNSPAIPTSTNAVWVTTKLGNSSTISAVTLTYDAGSGPINVAMYDDGAHNDGAAGDGTYGAQIPAFAEGTVVRYYVWANYDSNRIVYDPQNAPSIAYSYTVQSTIPVVPFNIQYGNIVLGRPTDQAITVSVLSSNNFQAYLRYGLAPGVYPNETPVASGTAGQPLEFLLTQLQPNTRYYYQMVYQVQGNATYQSDAMHTFHTQRAPGSTFSFSIHGDTHPERLNQMYDPNFYALTLSTAAADQPDFYMTIGDDFSVDNIDTNAINQSLVEYRYTLQRPFLGLVGNSAPIFLVNGNHEEASRWAYNNTDPVSPSNPTTRSNIAVWAQNARNRFYPEPAPDGFYGGMTNDTLPGIGQLRSCYSWTWGDALFVTIDPYWYSTNSVDTGYGLSTHPNPNTWSATHGDAQYFWLKQTLEQSKAKYKFIFAHHVMGTGRGGSDCCGLYEWGGQNINGTWGFNTFRPNWPNPIHQLMVANNVTAFIQGHDHIFVHQQKDGLIYQSLPLPADSRYSLFNADAYISDLIYKTNNSGYTRFTIGPSNVQVDYVRTILPANMLPVQVATNGAPAGVTNGQVGYSYLILPLTVTGTTNSAAVPGQPVAVTSAVGGGTNISQATLTYIVSGVTNTVAMFDDGAHQDGAAGDGVYGALIPAYPLGTLVRYYVHVVDAATRQFTDPSGAPMNVNLYAYTVGGSGPSITLQPQRQIVPVGSNVTLTVTANGPLPLSYQWQKSADGAQWNLLGGATNSQWQLTNAQLADTGYYQVLVTNAYGNATSSNALLTVLVPPVANPLVIYRGSDIPVRLAMADVLTNASDPQGFTYLGYQLIGAPAGSLSTNLLPGYFTFVPASPDSDASVSFQYIIQDNYTAAEGSPWLATNLVTINRVPNVGLAVSYSGGGFPLSIQFAGIPGFTYEVQRCTNLVRGVWTTVLTTNAPSAGSFIYIENESPGRTAFYRLYTP